MQKKQSEWKWQWDKIQYFKENKWLFQEWIYPNKLKDFKNKTVLDCGCGNGRHIRYVAPFAKRVVGVDLNSDMVAKQNIRGFNNIEILEDDIANMRLGKKFDIVFCIGVLHHTDNPGKTFNNLKKHVKRKGRLILWVYSFEGNFLNRTVLEFVKKIFFLRLSKRMLWFISNLITSALYIPIYTVYLLPLKFLPFYEYFDNLRKMSFKRVNHTIFDKLNAPTTHFIRESTLKKWFNPKEFSNIHISHYKGVSWRASGLLS